MDATIVRPDYLYNESQKIKIPHWLIYVKILIMGETEEMVDNYKYWRGGVFGGAMSNWFVSFEEFCEEFVFWGGCQQVDKT